MKISYVAAFNMELGEVTHDDDPCIVWVPILAWQIREDEHNPSMTISLPITNEGLCNSIDVATRIIGRTVVGYDGQYWKNEDDFLKDTVEIRKSVEKIENKRPLDIPSK